MTLAQYRILTMIGTSPAARRAAGASGPTLSKSTLTGLLDGLAARGWVRRIEIEGDRRGVGLELTDEGVAARQAGRASARRADASTTSASSTPRDRAGRARRPRRDAPRRSRPPGRRSDDAAATVDVDPRVGGGQRPAGLAPAATAGRLAAAARAVPARPPLAHRHRRRCVVVGQVVVALTPVIVKAIVDDTLVEPNRADRPAARPPGRRRRWSRSSSPSPAGRSAAGGHRRQLRPAHRGVRPPATARLRHPRPDGHRPGGLTRLERRRDDAGDPVDRADPARQRRAARRLAHRDDGPVAAR